MKKTHMLAVVMLFSIMLIGAAVGEDVNRHVRSPIGSSTVPPSSVRSELYRSPTGASFRNRNDVVTGNVAGGKHFRGSVPYSSQYGFGTSLGSDSTNSFLRRSAGNPYGYRSPGVYQPYYNPSRTVSSLRRGGQSGLSGPQVTFKGGTGKFKQEAYRPGAIDPMMTRQVRPFRDSTSQLEREMSLRMSLLQLEEHADKYLKDSQRFMKDIKKDDSDTTDKSGDKFTDNLLEPLKPYEPGKPLDLEQLQQLYRPKVEDEVIGEVDIVPGEVFDPVKLEDEGKSSEDGAEIGDDKQMTRIMAKGILGEHKDYKSFVQAKVDHYLGEANELMKQGKFYRADDSYRLAEIYAMDNPVVYGGRSLALLGAGEYMTSVFFLEMAIKADSDYARFRIDLAGAIGGQEKLDDRLVDINKWYEKSQAPELALMLAYVYYQQDDLTNAEEFIGKAEGVVKDSGAVEVLKKAIELAKTR